MFWQYTLLVDHEEGDDRPYTPRLMRRPLVVTVSLVLLAIFAGPYLTMLAMSVALATRESVDVYRAERDADYLAACLETFRDPRARAQASHVAWNLIEQAPLDAQRRMIRAWIKNGDGGNPTAVVLAFRYVQRANPAARAMLLDECVQSLLAPDADRVRLAGYICRAFSDAPPEQTGFPRMELPVCEPHPLDERAINQLAVYLAEWRSNVSP